MPSLPDDPLRIAGLCVAIALLALAAYPGTLAEPYDTARGDPSYFHTIVREDSSTYEEYAAEVDTTYRYEELSPAGQRFFDRALEAPRVGGGQRRFEPTVCAGFVLTCDAYAQSDLPPEFTYGTQLPPDFALQFVEKGGERYLLQTGFINHAGLFGFSNALFLAWPTVIPLGLFVGRTTLRSGSDRFQAGVTAFGAFVAVAAVAAPYLDMFDVASVLRVGVVLLAATWLLLVGAGGHRLYRWASGRGGSVAAGSS